MRKVLGLLLTMAMLLNIGSSIDWQGTGNMSEDNMTFIRNYIRINFKSSWKFSTVIASGDTTFANFTKQFSDNLNSEWDQAWNVILVFLYFTPISDSILYGYAFRDHWMWYNGITMDEGYYVSFIIWKDYNCIKWFTHNNNDVSGNYPGSYADSSSIVTALKSIQTALTDPDQVWLIAKAYADTFASNSGVTAAFGSDIAFSVIMSQSISAYYYGRFCAKNYVINYEKVGNKKNSGKPSDNWGTALILQMR